MNFDSVKRNYERKLWTIQLVKMAVAKGIIKKDEYKTITGFTYPATK